MAGVAQLVRASDCGPEGRGFNSHRSPQKYPVDVSVDTHEMSLVKLDSSLQKTTSRKGPGENRGFCLACISRKVPDFLFLTEITCFLECTDYTEATI